jgi:glycosyltransferase involved in cell wall biosynthesis
MMTKKQKAGAKLISHHNKNNFSPDIEQRFWKKKKLTKGESISIGTSVKAGDILLVKFMGTDMESPSPKGIVADVRYFDQAENILSGPFCDLGASQRYPAYFYVKTASPEKPSVTYRTVVVPEGAIKIEIQFVCHLSQSAVVVPIKPSVQVMNLKIIKHLLETAANNSDWMPAAVKLAQTQGSCFLLKRILEAWVKAVGGAPEVVLRWAAVKAELEELEPDWYPKLHVKASIPSSNSLYSICHLHKTAYPYENTGGAIRCLNILKSQQAIGLDPYLITPPGYPKSGAVDGAPTTERIEGIEHFRIGPDTAGITTLSLPSRTSFAAVQSARIIKHRGASLIHAASGVRGYELALQAFALRDVFDIPVIYEVRSFHEHTWTRAKDGILDLERTQLRILKENRCMEMADHIITISESMRDILIQRGVPAEKIDVVPNAIDESRYQDSVIAPISHEALVGAELVVGYVSNMSLREGHRYLLKAVAQLRSTGFDVRCLLVGSGPERQSLESLAQQLGISKFTAFVGEVDHSMINSYYLAIDVFVVPRVPDYAADWVTPLKPYEAMSLGRPLVVTDLPALREVTGNGERGRIAQPADSESLCKEILALVNDQAARTAMAKSAKKWVFENRTWAANAKRYRDIYGHVLNEYRQHRCINTLNSYSPAEFLIAANQN